ncbi:hypothetical protein AGMMS49940_15400 [Spirochaetia bacterium]|nr:hypothetical protein AGMMS49940_15400 [Spirochaetia bacterium]
MNNRKKIDEAKKIVLDELDKKIASLKELVEIEKDNIYSRSQDTLNYYENARMIVDEL